MLGVVEDVLCDRAFVPERATSAAELAHPGRRPDAAGGDAGAAQRRQRAGRGRAGPGPRRAARRGPGRAARLRPRPAPDRRGSPSATGCAGWTTPRRPTRTPPTPRWRAFDPVVWVAGGLAKGATFDDLVAAARRPAAGRRADRRGPGADRGRRWRDTRPMSPSSRWTSRRLTRCRIRAAVMDAVVARAGRARAAGRHRAARPRLRLDGPVHAPTPSAATPSPRAVLRGRSRRAGLSRWRLTAGRRSAPGRAAARPGRPPGRAGPRRRLAQRAGLPADLATTCCSGATVALVVIGLVMVLSSSSVES